MKYYVTKKPEKCCNCDLSVKTPLRGFCNDRECRSPECIIISYDYYCKLNTKIKNGIKHIDCPLIVFKEEER